MPIELKNSVFFHIPKTGGTFVSSYLLSIGGKMHKPLANDPNRLCGEHSRPKDFPTNKKTFAFIRHPLSWYQSMWKFKTNGQEFLASQDWDIKDEIYECRDTDFNRFVNNMLDKWPNGYVSWLYDQFPVDYIGRQGALRFNLISILWNLGEEFNPVDLVSWPNKNVSVGDAIYDRVTMERVLNIEKGALKRYES